MAYPISDVLRRIIYSGSAGVGPYGFEFEILEETDIVVYKNETLLTLSTDYSVTINADGTGSVELVSAAIDSDNITIAGNKGIQRSTDFVTGGDLFANSLNDEFDSQVIFIQQIDDKAERSLKAPITDPTDVNMTLPNKADRINQYLAFDENGNPKAATTPVEVQTIYENIAAIQTVGSDLSGSGFPYDLGTITDSATNPSASPDGYIIGVYDALADVTTVAGVAADVTSVAAVASDIPTVASNVADISTVADDLNEDVSEINTVATNIANVNTVGGISSNVTTVAGIAANVTTVAGVASNVTTVAGISTDVTAVAGIVSDVTTVAANIVDVQNAEENADAAIAAQAAAESARDATLAALDSFDDRYLGSKTSDPTLDNDGNALVGGALYFNSADGVMKVYTGSSWVAAYASLAGALLTTNNLSDLTNAASARTNLGGTTIGKAVFTASSALIAQQAMDVEIGVDVQAYDAQLADIAGLTPTDNGFIVGNGANFVVESGSTARTSLGLGTIATQDASSVTVTDLTVNGTFDCGSIA